MRVLRLPGAISAARRVGLRHRSLFAIVGGVLAVVPAVVASSSAASWVNLASTVHSGDVVLEGGYNPMAPVVEQISVDGSLPEAPVPLPLPAYELPSGPLGIPVTALAAYKNAADILAGEQPGCHIDWALIASIGRIESNHARGGYVDAAGNTLEPILGPVLNGAGPFAAIPDTDHGRYDGDTVWDRAVGPTQFIPGTWNGYASDGNGDGESNPNNIFDAALGTGRYLCSGGLDVTSPDQLRTAIFRYNHSDTYVNTVILWAEAYRSGVLPTPDSKVPVGAPNATVSPGQGEVPVPPSPPVSTIGTTPTTSPTSKPSTSTGSSIATTTPTTPPTPTTTPTCPTPTSTTTTTTTTTTSVSPTCIPPTPSSGNSSTDLSPTTGATSP
ncbi:lytic transglycosylase domain-containing protein [Amycolatopsis sp.]|uniref:lytic transglycosylase domain-containing protein n=1 Tax=Amycolatopsis sp. TaxID=37632 RepID=UPI002E00F3B7|nr:lytic transglycosylase domain-containing protein [Amycolatopsis sp.]